MDTVLFIITGIAAGTFSGLLGVGGGIIIVPTLVYVFKFSQHAAQGTTLALMVPPIGILGAYIYYKAGYVNVKAAFFICLGFFLGGLLGAKLAGRLPDRTLRKLFGIVLMLVALKMIVGR